MNNLILFYVPVPDEGAGKDLARQALEQKSAACANLITGVSSLYPWEGRLRDEPELILLLKTVPEHEEALKKLVLEVHPYDCPCILRLTGEANEAFAAWVREETG